MGIGDRRLPPQALDLERQTRGGPPLRPRTRLLLYAALAVTAVLVVGGLVWLLLPD